jgi:hypothetical protein
MRKIQRAEGVPNDSYHGDYPQFISSTSLKLFATSQLHYKHEVEKEKVSKPHFDFGNVYHTMVSSRHPKGIAFEEEYLIFEAPINDKTGQPYGADTVKMQEAKASFMHQAQAEERLLCSNADVAIATAMCKALFDDETHVSHEFFNKMYLRGIPEVSYFYQDFVEGINLRTRPDLDGGVSANGRSFIADYKTTEDLESFTSKIADYGYDISAGMYVEGKKAYMMDVLKVAEPEVDFYWIVQEKKAPYDWMIVSAEHWLEIGVSKFYQCLNVYKDAKDSGVYRGISAYCLNKHGIFKPKPANWNLPLNRLLTNNE